MRQYEIQTGVRYRDKDGSETRVVLRVENGKVMFDANFVGKSGRTQQKNRQHDSLENFANWAAMALPKFS